MTAEEIQSPSLAVLRPFTRVWIPETPPYRITGNISREGERWRVKGFEGKLGSSDLSGDLMFTMRNERPFMDGDLISRKLDLRDFAGLIGREPQTGRSSRVEREAVGEHAGALEFSTVDASSLRLCVGSVGSGSAGVG